jgi:AP endonuclease 1
MEIVSALSAAALLIHFFFFSHSESVLKKNLFARRTTKNKNHEKGGRRMSSPTRRSIAHATVPWKRLTRNSQFDPKSMWCFVSWNVNGIRSLDNSEKYPNEHPLVAVIRETLQPDVLCLQETKLSPPPPAPTAAVQGVLAARKSSSAASGGDAPRRDYRALSPSHIGVIPGYTFTDSISVAKKGYSGTRTYVKTSSGLASVSTHVALTSASPSCGTFSRYRDDEGRGVVSMLSDQDRGSTLALVNSYVPNSGMTLDRLGYRTETYDPIVRKLLADLHTRVGAGGSVIWTGDLNVAERDYDRYFATNFKAMQKVPGFTPEERASFRRTLAETRMVDSFRHLYPNAAGAYSFWSAKFNSKAKGNGWRLDYFVVSEALAERVVDSFMLPDVAGSDHCPIVLWLKK